MHVFSVGAGYRSVSVLITQGNMLAIRTGLWKDDQEYKPDPLTSFVEPISSEVLELERLPSAGRTIKHCCSMDRQCHTYLITEQSSKRAPPLMRVFTRCFLQLL